MIVQVVQVKNINVVTVEYKSGYKRYIYLDGWGYYQYPDTVRKFLNNAHAYDLETCTIWK